VNELSGEVLQLIPLSATSGIGDVTGDRLQCGDELTDD